MTRNARRIMTLSLKKITTIEELKEIQTIYQKSFKNLLNKYHDDELNPAKETLASIEKKFNTNNNLYYFIIKQNKTIGVVRIIFEKNEGRIAPVCILPEFQGGGLGLKTMAIIEKEHPSIVKWSLETIKQEEKLVNLYQKCGYQLTGKEEHISDNMDLIYFSKMINL